MQGGNAAIIKKQVQQQFQRNATETDPTKVRVFTVAAGLYLELLPLEPDCNADSRTEGRWHSWTQQLHVYGSTAHGQGMLLINRLPSLSLPKYLQCQLLLLLHAAGGCEQQSYRQV